MKYKNDILLIGGLLLCCLLAGFAAMYQGGDATDELQIYCGGALLSSLPTGQKACILLYCDNGSYRCKSFASAAEAARDMETVSAYNLILIDQGTVSVCDADCGGKDCVRQKEISKNGESIICLPHRVLLCLTNGEERTEDAVTW